MNTSQHFPVHSEYRPESIGGWQSTNLAWDDYQKMYTNTRKLASNRQIEPPVWALNDEPMRRLITRYVENRAGYRNPQPGTDAERLARAQAALDANLPLQAATLKRLCAELIELKKNDPVDKKLIRNLEQQIEVADTTLVGNRNVAVLLSGVIYYYYRVGMDSVGTAQMLNIKPPHVRQILWRCRREWERLQNPKPVKATRPFSTVDTNRAADLRAKGLTYQEMNEELGCSNVQTSLRRAGLWVPSSPLERAKKRAAAAIEKAEATLARLYVKDHMEQPLTIPRRSRGKYTMMFRGCLPKHVAIFERLVRENGGQLPSYRWMNRNGYFTTYMYLRRFPNAFRHLAP